MAEYQACAELQEEVWGRGFSERVPPAILMIANRIGGLTAGAFDPDGRLEGFVFGLTGIVGGQLVHWSDMLAVRKELRDGGLGTCLKLYQRQMLLQRGVTRTQWTFDPLQSRNAHLNFCKLGVLAREYVVNAYGETDSPLHRGVGTDRLVVTWDLDSPKVRARLDRDSAESGASSETDHLEASGNFWGGEETWPKEDDATIIETEWREGSPVPVSYRLDLSDRKLLVHVPENIGAMMQTAIKQAVLWRETTRVVFEHYLELGYEVQGFERGGGLSAYVLIAAGGPDEGTDGGDHP